MLKLFDFRRFLNDFFSVSTPFLLNEKSSSSSLSLLLLLRNDWFMWVLHVLIYDNNNYSIICEFCVVCKNHLTKKKEKKRWRSKTFCDQFKEILLKNLTRRKLRFNYYYYYGLCINGGEIVFFQNFFFQVTNFQKKTNFLSASVLAVVVAGKGSVINNIYL